MIKPPLNPPTAGISLAVSPPFLNVSVKPGETVRTEFKVRNNNNFPEYLGVTLNKFQVGSNGNTVDLKSLPPHDEFASWVTLSDKQFILDPNTLPGSGVLSWPLENVFVTQLFGKTSASKRLYASGSHSGVDFRASVGTPVLAMADGVVSGVGDTDTTCPGASFGKWIFIKYNNGLASAYGHLSLSKVNVGQKVSRGEVVGYSGNTGHTTGPHLHVTVYAKVAAEVKTLPSKSCVGKTLTQPIAPVNAYLDPMYYLPAYKSN
jgi:murein DD-endopeptidase MepM/ murein hydrolase activator NlpD